MAMQQDLLERFLNKIRPQGNDGCWLWAGALSSGSKGGYAYIWHRERGRVECAHRVSWELFRGPVPEGMTIDHICRVRNCVRPDHLRVATHRENVMAGVVARNAGAKTSAPVKVGA